MNEMSLMRRAVVLFPRTDYTEDSQVRSARRGWLRAVRYMREQSRSLWVIDHPVPREAQQNA